MRFPLAMTILGWVVATGCVPGEQRSTRPTAPTQTGSNRSVQDDCTSNATNAAKFTRITLNTEAVCDDGTAHMIMDTAGAAGQLEYRLEGAGLEIEPDAESRRAFLISSIVPGREYTLKALVGDGCRVTVAVVRIGADIVCPDTTANAEAYRSVAWVYGVLFSKGEDNGIFDQYQ